MAKKIHYEQNPGYRDVCGFAEKDSPITSNPASVTCGHCKKIMLKTYVYVYHEHNTHGQEGDITHTFKAENLEELDTFVGLFQNGNEDQIPKGRFSTKYKVPKRFFEAGGFAGHDVSFTCKETGEDMRDWWKTQGWGVIED
jgi:hypothetical protein